MMHFRITIIALAFSVCGCVANAPKPDTLNEKPDAALGRASVVSMGSLNLDPHKPSTITWLSPVEVIGGQDDKQSTALQSLTQLAIQNRITGKGYPLLEMAGDYQMRALLVLGQSSDALLSQSELLQKTGVDPGLVGAQTAQGKGSLVIELRQGRALRWRGAVQIYLSPDSDLNAAAERIEHAVAQLLFTWP